MQQEKLNKQRHQILELQETVQKLETEVKNLKNRCTNTVTSGQGKGGDVNIHNCYFSQFCHCFNLIPKLKGCLNIIYKHLS